MFFIGVKCYLFAKLTDTSSQKDNCQSESSSEYQITKYTKSHWANHFKIYNYTFLKTKEIRKKDSVTPAKEIKVNYIEQFDDINCLCDIVPCFYF